MFDTAEDTSVVGELVEGVAGATLVRYIAGEAVGHVARHAGVVEDSEAGDAFRADVVFFTEGAVANAAGHCPAGVVGQVVVGVTLLAHLEGAAAHTKGYRAAHAGIIVQLVIANAGLTLVLGRAAGAVLNVALDAGTIQQRESWGAIVTNGRGV